MDSIRIPIGPSGRVVAWATVDIEDYERIVAYRWYLAGRGYAFRTNAGESVFMHREVLNFPESQSINHINGDQLDNRKCNLEACTQQHNMQASGTVSYVYPIRDQIAELRKSGLSYREVSEKLGISMASVGKYASDIELTHHANLKWTRDLIIDATRSFVERHGRIPRQNDYRPENGLPWYPIIYRRFSGGLKELREAAGLGHSIDLRGKRGVAA